MKITQACLILIVLAMLLFTAPIHCYIVSDDGTVVHGVNQQGFDYYLNKQTGTVEFYDVPEEERNENIDTYYQYKVPPGTDAAKQLDYLQFTDSNPFLNNSNASANYSIPSINHQSMDIEAKTPWFSIIFISLMLIGLLFKAFMHFSS